MDRDQRRARLEQASGREKGLGLAYLILIGGALLLALPLTGIVDSERPDPDECVPGYSKCLDPAISDYDCAPQGEDDGPRRVAGPIVVTGDDPFELDPDGDGYGCI